MRPKPCIAWIWSVTHSPSFALSAPGELDVKEKDIEKWVVGKPEILFSDPDAVMIIAKEIMGELQSGCFGCR